jgi:hypothetical protein
LNTQFFWILWKCKLAMSVHVVGIGKCCHGLLAMPFFVWNVKLMMFRIVMVTIINGPSILVFV